MVAIVSGTIGALAAMGNALIARMATLAFRKGMQLRLNVNVLSLSERNGEVTGVEIEHEGQKQALEARCGVVLAAGGFAAGKLAERYRPQTREHYTMSPLPTTAPRCALPPRSMPAKALTCRLTFLGAGLRFTPCRWHAGALPHRHRSRQTRRDCRQPARGALRK